MHVSTETLLLTVADDGSGLALTDLFRAETWHLDEVRLVYSEGTLEAGGGRALKPLRPVSAGLLSESVIRLEAAAGDSASNSGLRICFDLTLADDHLQVTLRPEVESSVAMVAPPCAFAPASGAKRYVLPIMQGMLWDGRGGDFEERRGDGGHTGFSMAMMGTLGERGGLLMTAETGDDSRWWFGKTGADFWCTNLQTTSLGEFRYPRQARIYPTAPTVTDIAKRYRARIMERGRFRSWEEKIEERPNLERLFGSLWCFIGYCGDELDYAAECEKLCRAGFDRAFVYPTRFNTYHPDFQMGGRPPILIPDEQLARIKDIGYDVAPWSWLNEAMDDGSDRIRGIYRRNRDGEIVPEWAIDDQQWYEVCSSALPGIERAAIEHELGEQTWDHFDVVTCASNGECYATDHEGHRGRPLSRSEDRDWLRRLLRETQETGRIVSSESFNDHYCAEYDIGSVKAWPQFGPWPFWPVPLTSLVFHDSMLHTWWEVHNYNSPHFGRSVGGRFQYGGGRATLMACLDALYGAPPDVFPFGAQYGWTGNDHETFLYSFRFEDPVVQRALELARPVAGLHRDIGRLEMTGFRILSEDGYVQRTEFSDGTSVLANFAPDLRQADGHNIGGMSWRRL